MQMIFYKLLTKKNCFSRNKAKFHSEVVSLHSNCSTKLLYQQNKWVQVKATKDYQFQMQYPLVRKEVTSKNTVSKNSFINPTLIFS